METRHERYDTGRPTLRPRSWGLNFGELSTEEILKLPYTLTESENASPFAKYFYQETVELAPELKAALDGPPMDPSKAFMPEDYARHMNNTGYCDVENGYCILPNGAAYAAVKINQHGRTDEMAALYNNEFAPVENLFYKTWLPGSHLLHYNDGAVEDFGWGRANLKFTGSVFIEDLGLDPERISVNDPACININGASALIHTLEGKKAGIPERMTIVNYHRETPDGRELRIRFWYGFGMENGEYHYTLPEGGMGLDTAKLIMAHLAYEYSNDNRLETQFWNDRQAGRI